jgi:hypothetical protein
MKTVIAKLGKMKKAVDWVVYPTRDDENTVTIQSDARICQFIMG